MAVHQAVCTCAPGIAQQVAVSVLEALEGGKGAEDLQRNIGVFADRRARATRLLDAAGLRYAPAEGGFYLFVEVAPLLEKNGRGEDDLAFCLRLLSEEKLIAIPGSGFGPAGKGWVRLAYTCHEVEEGVGRFLRALGLSPSGDTP